MTKLGRVHIVIRYGDLHAPTEGTVALHRAVISQRGFVYMAKFGRSLGPTRIAQLDNQIRSEAATFVFLVKKQASIYHVTACYIEGCRARLSIEEREHVPDYYRGTPGIQTWFKVSMMRDLSKEALHHIIVLSSGRPVAESLAGSIAGAFIVKIDEVLATQLISPSR